MRGWGSVSVVAVLLGVAVVSGPVMALERDESKPAALDSVTERGAGGGFTEVASAIYAEPSLKDADLRIEAIVYVESGNGKHLKFVRCPLFVLARDDPRTTVTAFCEARKTALGKWAQFEITAYSVNDNAVSACGTARQLKRHTQFSCSVKDPRAIANTA